MSQSSTAGIIWFTAAMAFATGIDLSLKLTDEAISVAAILVLRGAMLAVVLMPFIWIKGVSVLGSDYPKLHVLRAVFWIGALYLTFLALRRLTLAETNGYLLTEPLFVVVLAVLALGERLTARKLVALSVGSIGVVVMMIPEVSHSGDGVGVAMAIAAALSFAGMAITMKKMVSTETRLAMLFWPQIFSIVVFTPIALPDWLWPGPMDWLWIATMAFCALATNLCLIKAFEVADASTVAPAAYSILPFAMLADWLVFDEKPALLLIIGAVIVMVAVLYAGQKDKRPLVPPVAD